MAFCRVPGLMMWSRRVEGQKSVFSFPFYDQYPLALKTSSLCASVVVYGALDSRRKHIVYLNINVYYGEYEQGTQRALVMGGGFLDHCGLCDHLVFLFEMRKDTTQDAEPMC